ncbi:MAG: AAA family ATPase [Archangium sp.]|nr:AAA family ATPase [Archangium sp.]
MSIQFTRLALSNWRNFRSVELELQERMFVVGPNAAGKTNLLDALKFLRDVAKPKGGLATALDERVGFTHLRSLHARFNSELKVAVTVNVDGVIWEYELALNGSKTRPFRVEREVVRRGDQVLLDRPDADDSKDARRLEQTHLEQVTQNAKFRALADALASTVFVHVVPQVVKSVQMRDVLRDAPGSDFIEQLAGLPNKKQKGALRRLEKLLKFAVPQFDELRVMRDKRSGTPHLEAKYAHWRPQGSWQSEREFSDGTVRLIGLLWAILEGKAPLVLEEPELSLHEGIVQTLPQLLHSAARRHRRQMFVSTHAMNMLADPGIDPREVIVLEPTDQETVAKLGSEIPEFVSAARSGLPLSELVGARTRPYRVSQLPLPLVAEP